MFQKINILIFNYIFQALTSSYHLITERTRLQLNDNSLDEEKEDQVGQLIGSAITLGSSPLHPGANSQLLRAQAHTPMEFPKGFSAKSRPSI